MQIKPGADVNGLHFLMWYAAVIYDYARAVYGLGEGTITSGKDSAEGRVSTTLHPYGYAIDLRTNDLPAGVDEQLAAEMRGALGGWFDVIVERDHIHVELSPSALQSVA